MVDVHEEAGPVVVIVADILPVVLGVLVLGQHDGMLVVGVVLHVAAEYIPYSPPGVAVGPDMNLGHGVHHGVGPVHLPVIHLAGRCARRRLIHVHGGRAVSRAAWEGGCHAG